MKWLDFERYGPPKNVNILITDGIGLNLIATDSYFEDDWKHEDFELFSDQVSYSVAGSQLLYWMYTSSVLMPEDLID